MKINRTTQRTVEILKYISKNPQGVALDEICNKMDMPRTSAYDIVTTLVHMDMINLVKGEKQKYTIGLGAYRIGISYTNNMDLVNIIEPLLKEFAKEMKKTVFYGIPSDNEIVYICKYEPEMPVITTAVVGMKNPMYCTSLGKAMLASMDSDHQRELIDSMEFVKRTEWTIDSPEKLVKELEVIKKQGYATDFREVEDHMVCIGAAVFGSSKEVIGAISISGLYREHECYEEQGRKVHEMANRISRLLGAEIS
jgi:DNA-binding IclR family transcriptional regulator